MTKSNRVDEFTEAYIKAFLIIGRLREALDITTRQLDREVEHVYPDQSVGSQHRPHIQQLIDVNRELIREADVLPKGFMEMENE